MNIQEPYRRFAVNLLVTYINGTEKKVRIIKDSLTGLDAANKAQSYISQNWENIAYIQLLNWEIITHKKALPLQSL